MPERYVGLKSDFGSALVGPDRGVLILSGRFGTRVVNSVLSP
jgi:hypothetical protein